MSVLSVSVICVRSVCSVRYSVLVVAMYCSVLVSLCCACSCCYIVCVEFCHNWYALFSVCSMFVMYVMLFVDD